MNYNDNNIHIQEQNQLRLGARLYTEESNVKL